MLSFTLFAIVVLSMALIRFGRRLNELTQETIDKAVEIDDLNSELYMRDERIDLLKKALEEIAKDIPVARSSDNAKGWLAVATKRKNMARKALQDLWVADGQED